MPCRGHVFLHLVSSDCALNDKNEGNSLRYGPNCCLQVEAIIQTLENDIKTSTEIIKILSEEWQNCCAKEEVRSDEGHEATLQNNGTDLSLTAVCVAVGDDSQVKMNTHNTIHATRK